MEDDVDEFTKGILQKARERERLLNEKIKSSEKTQTLRKRGQPLSENQYANIEDQDEVISSHRKKDSPKRSRFAALAEAINSWEDDLGHPVTKKEQPKKVWKPPPKKALPDTSPRKEQPKKVWQPLEKTLPDKPPRTFEHPPEDEAKKYVATTTLQIKVDRTPVIAHPYKRQAETKQDGSGHVKKALDEASKINQTVKSAEAPKAILKSPASARKVGVATSAVQEKLAALQKNWQSNEIATKIQQQKQAELDLLKNRWKNGMPADQDDAANKICPRDAAQSHVSKRLPEPTNRKILLPGQASPAKHVAAKEVSSSIPPPPPPPITSLSSSTSKLSQKKPTIVSTATWTKSPAKSDANHQTPSRLHELIKNKITPVREDSRNKLGEEGNFQFDKEKLEQMGFSLEDQHKAELDLTPYKKNQPETPKKREIYAKVDVHEELHQKIIFDKPERVLTRTVKRRDSFYETDEDAASCSENPKHSRPASSYTHQASARNQQPIPQDSYEDEDESSHEYTFSDDESGDVEEALEEAFSSDETDESPEPPPVVLRHKPPASFRKARPISQPPDAWKAPASNVADYYGVPSNRNSAPLHAQQDDDSSGSDLDGEEQYLPMTINKYRHSRGALKNAPTPKKTIVKHVEHGMRDWHHDTKKTVQLTPEVINRRIQELNEMVHQEQNVIMQTSNALNQCCGANSNFAGSQEAIECHKLLLTACKKREVYLQEIQRLKLTRTDHMSSEQGSLTINNIRLPIKQEFLHRIGGPNDTIMHYFIILLRHQNHVVFTQMVCTHDTLVRGTLEFPNLVKFNNIQQDFRVDLEVYGMSVVKDSLAQTPKKKKAQTPKKGKKGASLFPNNSGGVRSTNFVMVAHMSLNYGSLNKTHFNLERVPMSSPLQGTIFVCTKCLIENRVEEEGFLTMFEDVSGFGAWHRRWFVLRSNCLMYWKYPEEERTKEPVGVIDLKQVVTDTVGLIPRDICARPNTFELLCERVSLRDRHNISATKYWLACDTKDDRTIWCSKLNEALENLRTWHKDAVRPVSRHELVSPYNPYCPPDSSVAHRVEVLPFLPQNRQSAL